jgi:hypothetical protein
MPNQFTDIKIAELDDAASGPSGEGALLRLVLKLSQSTPSAWSQYFNDVWGQHFYMMKRRASISGDRLEIICMPEELETDHLPELKKMIAKTNEAYGRYLEEEKGKKEIEMENTRRQREVLSGLKGRLKLD